LRFVLGLYLKKFKSEIVVESTTGRWIKMICKTYNKHLFGLFLSPHPVQVHELKYKKRMEQSS